MYPLSVFILMLVNYGITDGSIIINQDAVLMREHDMESEGPTPEGPAPEAARPPCGDLTNHRCVPTESCRTYLQVPSHECESAAEMCCAPMRYVVDNINTKTWLEAEQACEDADGKLAMFKDSHDIDQLWALKGTGENDAFQSLPYWIGIKSLDAGGYQFVDGTPAGAHLTGLGDYSDEGLIYWSDAEVDANMDDDRCMLVYFFGDNMSINDYPCGDSYNFICEEMED